MRCTGPTKPKSPSKGIHERSFHIVMGILSVLLWFKTFVQWPCKELRTRKLLGLTLLTDTLQHELCATISSRLLTHSLETDLAKFYVIPGDVDPGSNLVPPLLANFVLSFSPYLI